MIPGNLQRGAIVVLAALLMGGCATKGYVKDRIAESDARNGTELDRVRETASGARELGDAAARDAMEARRLALGDVDWTEVAGTTVTFAFDSAELSEEARAGLEQVAGTIASSRRAHVDIYGYTDTIGDALYNDYLSARRANAVLRHLLDASRVPLTRFSIVGLGESVPVGEGDAEDHDASRRVVVSVLEPATPEGAEGETQLSQAGADRGAPQ